MRIPKSPPDLSVIYEKTKHDPERFFSIYDIISKSSPKKYLHWDKLRYYPPPEGFSHEEWWLALKRQRQALYKSVPLRNKEGKPFNYLEADPIPEILHKIDLAVGQFHHIPDEIKKTETKNRYYINSIMQEALTSSQLEGAATTRLVAKEMLRTGRQPYNKSEQMILNNFAAMKQIEKLKDEPLSKDLIFEIHQLVTEKTLDDPTGVGRFRKSDEKIAIIDMYNEVFHEPPPAGQLEERMALMCDFANEKNSSGFIHPVIRSIILHFWMAYDHPFIDGNGRTARALFYWSMLRYRYWLFEFISISQIMVKAPAKYARTFLYTETDENDLTYFLIYHLNVISSAIKELHKYIEHKNKRLQLIEKQLHGFVELNHRQRALISHALRNKYYKYTIKSHQISHNVAYQTARTDLFDLETRKLLKSDKIGKTWYFTPVNDLEEKLTELP